MDVEGNQGTQGAQAPAPPVKRLVHYKVLLECRLGAAAIVIPCDHPSDLVSNRGFIATSQVVSGLDAEGRFETLNTRYAPIPKPKAP